MKFTWGFILLASCYLGFGPSLSEATCVLASEFGFTLNCAFKKSGLFRVRNLGGVKAHVGLGFTLGDELGFAESLSNLEGNKRRSTSGKASSNAIPSKENRITVQNVSLKPIENDKVEKTSTTQFESVSSTPKNEVQKIRVVLPEKSVGIHDARSVQLPPIVSIPSVPVTRRAPISSSPPPPFKPIPPATDAKQIIGPIIRPKISISTETIPEFQALPVSVLKVYANQNQISNKISSVAVPSNEQKSEYLSPNNLFQRVMTTSNSTGNLAGLSPVEADILARKQALKQKQAMLLAETTATTHAPELASYKPPARTGPAATVHKHSGSKVMNAPKEYYPIGYDKNFDDNFASRVELPETSFYCGDQKHFPGLYADEDLGCMVFHVCALTDDGLIMKSFLCPESTLFDQTILKCNWWFYVDCKNSKNLYDSNIPVSKSYQLMKALTFFSAIKKESAEKS